MDRKLAELAGPDPAGRGGRGGRGAGGRGGRGGGGPPPPESFGSIQGTLLGPANALQAADETPTTPTVAAANDQIKAFSALKAKWDAIVKTDVPALNAKLKAAGAQPVTIPPAR
jgi:hypothetical protein